MASCFNIKYCLPLNSPDESKVYIFLNLLYGSIALSRYDVDVCMSVDLLEYPETTRPEQGLKWTQFLSIGYYDDALMQVTSSKK